VLGAGELVPLISLIIQRGKCRHCGAAIDQRHVTIELAAALVGAVALSVAPGLEGLAGALFGWSLIALIALDSSHFWLPDKITLPLLIAGLGIGLLEIAPSITDRLWGAAAGFSSLWLIATGYRILRQREGLGGGDPKLLAAIGAWLGWQALPFVLLGGSLFGLSIVLLRHLRGQTISATDRLPLGALMALAAFPLWIWLRYEPL
jgi:leader peptidase (prepilin peptidase) / N-methyltransferase